MHHSIVIALSEYIIYTLIVKVYVKGGSTSVENASDRDLLELVVAQVSKLSTDMSGIKSDMAGMKTEITGIKSEMTGMKSEIGDIKKTVLRIEHDHGEKLSALFDGYKQNSEKLDRVEKEVARRDEFIMKRIK